MARLREWHYNKNSMLELVRSQKAELPMVAGAEELIMSASDIISSEINRRTKAETISGKYGVCEIKSVNRHSMISDGAVSS